MKVRLLAPYIAQAPLKHVVVVFGLVLLCFATPARAEPQWLTLPPTPSLPTPVKSGYAPVNGIRIWYATFGHGTPVILLHGGLANANYWGELVPALASHYQVIVMDSRAAAARATPSPMGMT